MFLNLDKRKSGDIIAYDSTDSSLSVAQLMAEQENANIWTW